MFVIWNLVTNLQRFPDTESTFFLTGRLRHRGGQRGSLSLLRLQQLWDPLSHSVECWDLAPDPHVDSEWCMCAFTASAINLSGDRHEAGRNGVAASSRIFGV